MKKEWSIRKKNLRTGAIEWFQFIRVYSRMPVLDFRPTFNPNMVCARKFASYEKAVEISWRIRVWWAMDRPGENTCIFEIIPREKWDAEMAKEGRK